MQLKSQPFKSIPIKPICKYIEFNYIKTSVSSAIPLCFSVTVLKKVTQRAQSDYRVTQRRFADHFNLFAENICRGFYYT